MSLLSRIGRSVAGKSGRTLKRTAFVGGVGGYGLASGIGNSDISSGVYEFATGDPNIDNYIFGTDVGIRELMMPLPGGTMNTIKGGGFRGGTTALTRGMFNSSTIGRNTSARNASRDPRMPFVDGNVVFGAYNSRSGR